MKDIGDEQVTPRIFAIAISGLGAIGCTIWFVGTFIDQLRDPVNMRLISGTLVVTLSLVFVFLLRSQWREMDRNPDRPAPRKMSRETRTVIGIITICVGVLVLIVAANYGGNIKFASLLPIIAGLRLIFTQVPEE